jgi:alpha-L-fucosidase
MENFKLPPGVDVDEKDYLRMEAIPPVKWQSSGEMAHSYGYNRTEERADKYKSVEKLVETLIDVVSKNGNVLYAILFDKPQRTVELKLSKIIAKASIKSVQLLNGKVPLTWDMEKSGICKIAIPKVAHDHTYVIKIELDREI